MIGSCHLRTEKKYETRLGTLQTGQVTTHNSEQKTKRNISVVGGKTGLTAW